MPLIEIPSLNVLPELKSLETVTPGVVSSKSFKSVTCLFSISSKLTTLTDPITSDSATGYLDEITTISSVVSS